MSDLDEIFNEFARAFVGVIRTDRDIAYPDRLDRDALDGSLDSLKIVDSYLEFLHANRAVIAPAQWDTTVLWGGAYVGEVIRHARPGFFRWVDYNDYMPAHPDIQRLIPERTVLAALAIVVSLAAPRPLPLSVPAVSRSMRSRGGPARFVPAPA